MRGSGHSETKQCPRCSRARAAISSLSARPLPSMRLAARTDKVADDLSGICGRVKRRPLAGPVAAPGCLPRPRDDCYHRADNISDRPPSRQDPREESSSTAHHSDQLGPTGVDRRACDVARPVERRDRTALLLSTASDATGGRCPHREHNHRGGLTEVPQLRQRLDVATLERTTALFIGSPYLRYSANLSRYFFGVTCARPQPAEHNTQTDLTQ